MIPLNPLHKRIQLIVLSFLFVFTAVAAENGLDSILKQYPAKNANQLKSLSQQVIERGKEGVVDLCSRLSPPEEGGDVNVRFAISGLTKTIQLQGDEADRTLVVKAFLDALQQAENREVKAFLIRQIQVIGKKEAISPLSRYLTDQELCEPAAQALYAIKTPEASAALLFALSQVDDPLKPTIIKTLGDLQSRAAALAIIPYTESNDLDTRLMAYYAIANIGDPSAANPLKRALTKTTGYEQSQAISAYLLFAKRLAEAGAEEDALNIYASVLNTYTTAEDVNIQNAALTGLASIKGDEALPLLLEAMDSSHKAHRDVALKLAPNIEGNKATWQWIEKSKNVAPEVRAEILAFLGTRGDQIALPTLLNALNDENKNVQLEALTASFNLGGLESVPYYIELLNSEDGELIRDVKETLLQVPGDYLMTTISYILPTVSNPSKVALMDIIARRKTESFFYDVMAFTKDESSQVQRAAIRALDDIGTPENLNEMVALFDEITNDGATQEIENSVVSVLDAAGSQEQQVNRLVELFDNISDREHVHLLNLLARVRGKAAWHAAADYLANPNLKEDAARAICQIICPQEGDGLGICTNKAYQQLEEIIPLLKDDELVEKAKKHLPPPLPEPDEEGFVSLFNGKDMTGWIWNNSWKDSESGYKTNDGVMECDPKGGGNIYTAREYGDFILRFEFKLPPEANNGLGVRAPLHGDAAYTGMELQILDDDHPTYNWIKPYQAHGSVYGMIPAERGHLKPHDEWNQEEVKLVGRWITITLNGHVIVDAHLDKARMPKTLDGRNHPGATRMLGHLGFLGHGHPVAFRNLRIKELDQEPRPDNVPPEGFTTLFNGEDLTNWKGLVANPVKRAQMTDEELAAAQAKANERMRQHWNVVDGVLVFDGKGQNLCTKKDYADFELLVDWKIKEKGDSGIYLRGSPQVQIWDAKDHGIGSGGLYNNKNNPSQPLVMADNPIGEWNSFRIIMIGERVTIYLNDQLVVDNVVMENYWERDKPIYPTGSIELQNHGNTLYFKNIYIREL